ncbi:MAG TPA: hypothetical protein VF665_14860 [Longimicrobium sp.]
MYRCDLFSRDRSGGFVWREVALSFPKPELHEAGAKREYRYIGYSGNDQVRIGNCVNPATERAIRRVDRLFRLTDRPQHSTAGGMTTASCPKENEAGCFELAPVATVACQYGGWYPDCESKPEEFQECDWWNPCGSDDDGSPSTSPTGGGGAPPPNPCYTCEPDPNKPCATGDPVIDNPDVNGIFQSLWNQSNYGPNVPQAQRSEHGAWIISENGRLSAVPMSGVSSPCGIDPGPKPANAVGAIHTHPWHLGEMMTSCGGGESPYVPVASDEDAAALASWGFSEGYIMDAQGISKIFPGQPGVSGDRKARCRY